MKIEVTLTFPPEAVYRNCFAPGFYRGGDVDGYTPKVQFCGEWFESGQTRVLEVFDSYHIVNGCHPDFDGNMSVKDGVCFVERFIHSAHTGHLFTGCKCSCDRIALKDFFTPHELMRQDGNIVVTGQGVTISWKKVEK
jgi:hypothetical protein